MALLDIDGQRLDRATRELGDWATAIRADVRSPDQVRSAVERATTALGGVDTLIACAGVIHVERLADVTEEDWNDATGTNSATWGAIPDPHLEWTLQPGTKQQDDASYRQNRRPQA